MENTIIDVVTAIAVGVAGGVICGGIVCIVCEIFE